MVARLREGAAPRAAELVRSGPPFDPGERGFDRHAVYVAADHVVFVFESDAADAALSDLIAERVRSEAFAEWAALLESPPEIAVGGYYWRRTG